MARVREQQLNKTEQLTPAARLVDTFVAPENNNDAFVKAQRLNAALGKFADGAKDYMAVKQQVITEENIIEGQAAATQSKVDFKTAINEGLIPAGASPWYRQGYEREDGDRLAQQYSKESAMAYSKWTGKETASPEAYNDWISGIRKDFTAKNLNSPNQMAGFMKRANASDELNSAKHTTAVVAKMEFDRHQVTTDNIRADIQGYLNDEMLYEELAENTLRRAEQYFLDGATGKQVRESVVTSFLLQAKDNLDETLIDKLLELNISGRGKLGTIAGVREKAETLRGTILSKKYTNQTRLAKLQKEADKKAVKNGIFKIMMAMGDDPMTELNEEQNALKLAITKIDPTAAITLSKYRNILETEQTREDDELLSRLYIDAASGALTAEDLPELISSGDIQNNQSMKSLIGFVVAQEQRKLARENKIESDNRIKQNNLGKSFNLPPRQESFILRIRKGLEDAIRGNESSRNSTSIQQATAASIDFTREMQDWLEENPDAKRNAIIAHAKLLEQEQLEMVTSPASEIIKERERIKEILLENKKLTDVYGKAAWIYRLEFESKDELLALVKEAQESTSDNKLRKILSYYDLATREEVQAFLDQQTKLMRNIPINTTEVEKDEGWNFFGSGNTDSTSTYSRKP